MEQIQADPEVCALTGTQPPAPKRQKTAAGAASAAAGAANRAKSKPRAGRTSEPGYTAPPVIPDYGVPHRIAPHEGERQLAAFAAFTITAQCFAWAVAHRAGNGLQQQSLDVCYCFPL